MQWQFVLFVLVPTILSGAAALTAWLKLRAVQRLLATSSTRSLAQLDATVADLESSLSSITTTVRRLTSRIGMQDLRERRRSSAAESVDQLTKPQLRQMLANGKLRVVRDNPGPTAG